MIILDIKDRLLKFLSSENRAVTPKEALAATGAKNKDIFRRAVKELKLDAKITENNKGKYAVPSALGFTAAKIITYCNGFLFARPLTGGDDIYIPVEKSLNAIVNDIVMINRIKTTEKGTSGFVKEIVSNGKRLANGFIKNGPGCIYFVADNGYKCNIPVIKGDITGICDSDKVQVKLLFQKNKSRLCCQVVRIYGKAYSAKVCADSIIDESGIPREFSKSAAGTASEIYNRGILPGDIARRTDFRDEAVFTIDDADAKDLDDAISISKTGNMWVLGVHIADVSHYVQKDSILDKEAMNRGTSVYFADRVIPMFPTEISNGICSLTAGEDRLTFSAIINMDCGGNVLSFEFKKGIINSKVKGVYSEVNDILDGKITSDLRNKYTDVLKPIMLAGELSALLTENAIKRGKLDIDSSEAKFLLDNTGVCTDVTMRKHGKAQEMIENFMVLANECAAKFAENNDVPFVYRVHGKPDPNKVKELGNIIEILGFKLPKGAIIKPKPQYFVSLLKKANETKYSRLISEQVLRAMSKAKYSETPIGHFGLSLKDYCHFTSPIRRYPDVTIHRILSDLVIYKNIKEIKKRYTEFVKKAAYLSSLYEIRAVKAERDAEKYYMAEYMAAHLDEEFEGIISAVLPQGFFVELYNTIEGFVNLEKTEHGKFLFDGSICHRDIKTGKKLMVGDNIKVKVESVSVPLGTIDFSICL